MVHPDTTSKQKLAIDDPWGAMSWEEAVAKILPDAEDSDGDNLNESGRTSAKSTGRISIGNSKLKRSTNLSRQKFKREGGSHTEKCLVSSRRSSYSSIAEAASVFYDDIKTNDVIKYKNEFLNLELIKKKDEGMTMVDSVKLEDSHQKAIKEGAHSTSGRILNENQKKRNIEEMGQNVSEKNALRLYDNTLNCTHEKEGHRNKFQQVETIIPLSHVTVKSKDINACEEQVNRIHSSNEFKASHQLKKIEGEETCIITQKPEMVSINIESDRLKNQQKTEMAAVNIECDQLKSRQKVFKPDYLSNVVDNRLQGLTTTEVSEARQLSKKQYEPRMHYQYHSSTMSRYDRTSSNSFGDSRRGNETRRSDLGSSRCFWRYERASESEDAFKGYWKYAELSEKYRQKESGSRHRQQRSRSRNKTSYERTSRFQRRGRSSEASRSLPSDGVNGTEWQETNSSPIHCSREGRRYPIHHRYNHLGTHCTRPFNQEQLPKNEDNQTFKIGQASKDEIIKEESQKNSNLKSRHSGDAREWSGREMVQKLVQNQELNNRFGRCCVVNNSRWPGVKHYERGDKKKDSLFEWVKAETNAAEHASNNVKHESSAEKHELTKTTHEFHHLNRCVNQSFIQNHIRRESDPAEMRKTSEQIYLQNGGMNENNAYFKPIAKAPSFDKLIHSPLFDQTTNKYTGINKRESLWDKRTPEDFTEYCWSEKQLGEFNTYSKKSELPCLSPIELELENVNDRSIEETDALGKKDVQNNFKPIEHALFTEKGECQSFQNIENKKICEAKIVIVSTASIANRNISNDRTVLNATDDRMTNIINESTIDQILCNKTMPPEERTKNAGTRKLLLGKDNQQETRLDNKNLGIHECQKEISEKRSLDGLNKYDSIAQNEELVLHKVVEKMGEIVCDSKVVVSRNEHPRGQQHVNMQESIKKITQNINCQSGPLTLQQNITHEELFTDKDSNKAIKCSKTEAKNKNAISPAVELSKTASGDYSTDEMLCSDNETNIDEKKSRVNTLRPVLGRRVVLMRNDAVSIGACHASDELIRDQPNRDDCHVNVGMNQNFQYNQQLKNSMTEHEASPVKMRFNAESNNQTRNLFMTAWRQTAVAAFRQPCLLGPNNHNDPRPAINSPLQNVVRTKQNSIKLQPKNGSMHFSNCDDFNRQSCRNRHATTRRVVLVAAESGSDSTRNNNKKVKIRNTDIDNVWRRGHPK
eukprot:GHVL01018789.1.p1 GENE.GHVL01018789.1~~GHVL01018789.1.p1  ORF type:complete len:1210 (+),score=184.76 GHVL01018789.1:961-4590(+)